MKSSLLNKKADESPAPLKRDRIMEIATQNKATVISAADVTLNDELCHPVIIYTEQGEPIVGVMIKDLEADENVAPIVVERNFCPKFIESFRDAFIKARVIGQDIEEAKNK